MSWRLLEFHCDQHGRFETLLPRSQAESTSSLECPSCSSVCERVLSAPKIHTVWGAAANRGSYEPPPNPGYLSTRALAEGQSYSDWKKARREFRAEERRQQIKKEVG